MRSQIRRLHRRVRGDERGFSLAETLVTVGLVGMAVTGMTVIFVQTSGYAAKAVSYAGARQVNQDAIGYLASAPLNVVQNIATTDGGWANAPTTLPGVNAKYATQVRLLSSASNAALSASSIEVDVKTCYQDSAHSPMRCYTDQIVRPGIDLAQNPPPNLPTSAVPCDGSLTADNQCTPGLTASLGSDSTTVTLTVVRPKAVTGSPTVTYEIQRALDDTTFAAASQVSSTTVATKGTAKDTPPARSATDSSYAYRVRYTSSGFTSAWSPTRQVIVPASHTACTATPPLPASSSCTPLLALGALGDPDSSGKVAVPLTITGPNGQVTYTIQVSTDPSFPTGSATSTRTYPGTGPTVTPDPDFETPGATVQTYYYRVSFDSDATTHQPVWSKTAPITIPGA